MIVVLGELGGRDEYSLVEALKSGKINKPVCAWVSGTCARLFKSEVQFGHAVSMLTFFFLEIVGRVILLFLLNMLYISPYNQGAKSGGEMESAQAKNQALKEAGAIVPTSYEAFESSIKETFAKLVRSIIVLFSCFIFLPIETQKLSGHFIV